MHRFYGLKVSRRKSASHSNPNNSKYCYYYNLPCLKIFLISRFQEKRWKALEISHFVLQFKLTSTRKINRTVLWVYKQICFIANIKNNNNNKFQSCEDILSAGVQVSPTHGSKRFFFFPKTLNFISQTKNNNGSWKDGYEG